MERNPVGWFEIPILNTERALNFYSTLFQVEFEKYDSGSGEMYFFPHADVKGAGGALVKNQNSKPSATGVLIYFTSVTGNLTKEGQLAKQQGGKVLIPTMNIGEHGHVTILLDSEGNKIALHTRQLKED